MSESIPCPDAHLTLWQAFADKEYRHAYNEGHVGDYLASQVHSMRLCRGWTQGELATLAGATQPQICNWESSCEGVRLTSLHKLAEAFDVGLLVKFVPFSKVAREAMSVRADEPVPSYGDESPKAISYPDVRLLAPEPRLTRKQAPKGSSSYLTNVSLGSTGGVGVFATADR